MEKHFNLSRYKEFLKLEESGKISFLDENYLELLSSNASVVEQINYNRKKDYFLLIHEYLSRVIPPYEFRSKFLQMEREDSKKATILLEDFQELEVFTLAEDLEKFSDFINQISTLCFEYDEVWDGTMERMSENEFYYLVNNHYLQLQKAFPFNIWEISSNNQAYKHLVSRSFKFLMFTIGLEILLILFNIRTIN